MVKFSVTVSNIVNDDPVLVSVVAVEAEILTMMAILSMMMVVLMEGCIYLFLYNREGAPFLSSIKKVKQRLVETGTLTHWLKDVIKQRVRVTRKKSNEYDVAVMEALKPSVS